jgi:hypothetical protein
MNEITGADLGLTAVKGRLLTVMACQNKNIGGY